MPRFLIEYLDYEKLLELSNKNIDISDEAAFNLIIKKYSIPTLINEIKADLWQDVKKYKQGTKENTIAYEKYKEFDKFTTNLKEHIEDKNITFEMLTNQIKVIELKIKDGTQA